MANWTTVNTDGTPILQTATDEAAVLLRFAWVITLERFVLISEPKKMWTVRQFDEAQRNVPLPDRLKPSQYIRDLNYDYRVANHLEMAPDKPTPIYQDDNGFQVLNLFQGNAIPPESCREAPDLFLNHLRYIYGDSADTLEHALKWMAHVLYRPQVRINHGLVLSGKSRTGKSTIKLVLNKLIGPSHRMITPELFTASFQDWMVNKRLITVEEIKEHGVYSVYNKVKHYFTEDEIPVNPKGKTMFDLTNHLHFMFFSNHHYPIPLEEGDRRIHYVESKAEPQGKEYYNELYKYLALKTDGAGVWAFGKYLKDVILPTVPDDFAFVPPPRTPEHVAAVSAFRHPIKNYVQECRNLGLWFWAPRRIFRWSSLRADLRSDYGYMLRAEASIMAVLADCNLTREVHKINGKQETVCWFNDDKEFDEELKILWKDTTREGRKKLNSYCEFSDDVNMKEFVVSDNPDDEITFAEDPHINKKKEQ